MPDSQEEDSKKKTSQKQIEANRRNAKKSTGPKTEQGKQVVSGNSVKHGMYSKQIVIQSMHYSEDPEEYEVLYESLVADLEPENSFQEHLVRKITNAIWRSRRVIFAESAAIKNKLLQIEGDVKAGVVFSEFLNTDFGEDRQTRMAQNLVNRALIPGEDMSVNLLRYEMRMDRQLTRLFRLYRQVKKGWMRGSKKRRKK